MHANSVLISGAGIAGPTLAYWLVQHGFRPTLIERAQAPRSGGYMIDFWGLGYEVADRMGLVPRLKSAGYAIDEVRFVNERGKRIAGFRQDAIRSVVGDRYLSILRGDLADHLYEMIAGEVDVMYGDSVSAIEQSETGARVIFEHNAPREFDLVVGADGLHSRVRRIAFGNGSFEKYLGYYAASFSIAGYPWREPLAYVCYAMPGKQVARYALRGDRTVFFFICAADPELATELAKAHSSPQDHKRLLRETFAEDDWEIHQILAAMDSADDLYFDIVSQVQTDRWSSGRVVLVGDAAFCPSLLAGEGASLAMAAAYILAGELKKAAGDHRVAFSEYERRFRPFIEEKQRAAQRFAAWFAPKSKFGLGLRNATMRLMAIPLLARWFARGIVSDRLISPDYFAR